MLTINVSVIENTAEKECRDFSDDIALQMISNIVHDPQGNGYFLVKGPTELPTQIIHMTSTSLHRGDLSRPLIDGMGVQIHQYDVLTFVPVQILTLYCTALVRLLYCTLLLSAIHSMAVATQCCSLDILTVI